VNERLWQACIEGNSFEVLNLLDKKLKDQLSAFSNAKGPQGWTALHFAAFSGHLNICKILVLHEDPADIEACTDDRKTALHLASMQGHADILEFLLSLGADIDYCDYEFNTPLHYAAISGSISCTQILLSHSPNIFLTNRFNQTPFEASSSLEVRKMISDYIQISGEAIQLASYSRVPFHTVLLRNSRKDMVSNILSKSNSTHSNSK
jgi:ankyrin repeat protein